MQDILSIQLGFLYRYKNFCLPIDHCPEKAARVEHACIRPLLAHADILALGYNAFKRDIATLHCEQEFDFAEFARHIRHRQGRYMLDGAYFAHTGSHHVLRNNLVLRDRAGGKRVSNPLNLARHWRGRHFPRCGQQSICHRDRRRHQALCAQKRKPHPLRLAG